MLYKWKVVGKCIEYPAEPSVTVAQRINLKVQSYKKPRQEEEGLCKLSTRKWEGNTKEDWQRKKILLTPTRVV